MNVKYLVRMGSGRSLPSAVPSLRLASGWIGIEDIGTPFLDPSIDTVIPNERIEFNLAVDGPAGAGGSINEAASWGYDFLGIAKLVGLGIDGSGVRIGVLDSGVESDHEALQAAFTGGRVQAFAEFDENGKLILEHLASPVQSTYGHWHGTFVGSLLAASSPSGITNGVAIGADIFIVKVLDSDNYGSVASIHEGLCWLKDKRCDFVNLSLGWAGKRPHWYWATNDLLSQGTVVFCASGNEFSDKTSPPTRSPANYPIYKTSPFRLISVGAIGLENGLPVIWESSGRELVDWSAYKGSIDNPFFKIVPIAVPDLVAPGKRIISAGLNDTYRMEPGTSFATPYVVGIATIILGALRSKNISAAPDEAVSLLIACLTGPSTLETGRGWPSGQMLFEKLQSILAEPA